jgi:DNA-binding XRE family transcriptional regulator
MTDSRKPWPGRVAGRPKGLAEDTGHEVRPTARGGSAAGAKHGDRLRVSLVDIGARAERVLRKAAPALELIEADESRSADYVLLPAGRYAELLDAFEDRAATDAYERTLGEESVPAAIADRLLAGESPIRVWREHRGMTLDQLAAATGKAKGFLSEIESGKKAGSLDTRRAIARALSVDLDDIA